MWDNVDSLLKDPLRISSRHIFPFTLPTTSDIESHAQIHHTMNYPDAASLDLSAFSHSPDALTASEEEIATWAQLGEYSQPEPDVRGVPLDIVDAVLALGPSRTTPAETYGLSFEDNLVSAFAFGT